MPEPELRCYNHLAIQIIAVGTFYPARHCQELNPAGMIPAFHQGLLSVPLCLYSISEYEENRGKKVANSFLSPQPHLFFDSVFQFFFELVWGNDLQHMTKGQYADQKLRFIVFLIM